MYSLILLIVLFCSVIYLAATIFQIDLVIYMKIHSCSDTIQIYRKVIQSEFFFSFLFFPFQNVQRGVSFDILLVLISTANGSVILYMYCSFGKKATDSFNKIGECMYNSNWHVLSIRAQKYLVLMIGNAQRPIQYHGFRIAVLNLETFLKVNARE